MSELALTLPFFLFAYLFVEIADMLKDQEVGQKIFFIGSSWILSLIGTAAVHVVSGEMGYPGVQDLTTGVIIIGTVGLFGWTLYMITNIFTDIMKKATRIIG
jgi:hypothetical protein